MSSPAVPLNLFLSLQHEVVGDRLVRRLTTPGISSEASRPWRGGDPIDLAGEWLRGRMAGDPVSSPTARAALHAVELFCGPGGLALGFDEACSELGASLVSEAAVDQDVGAVEVYAANHGARIRCSKSASELIDYRVRGAAEAAKFAYTPELLEPEWESLVGRVDVVLAGPPCQGHSNLNNKTRRVDRRNELYLTVPAMAVALGADVVVIENVPAVVHDRSQVVASTIQLLQSNGYSVEGGVLSAPAMGWVQTRQRYFLVARRSAAPLPLADVQQLLTDSARSVTWAIGDLVDQPFDDRLHLSIDLSEENRRRIDFLFDNDLYDLPISERPDCHREGTTYGAVYGRLRPDRPAPTITTGFLTPGRGRFIHPTRRRTLTPWEAARLQGFPDGYDFFPNPANPPTKAKLTKWIGDAVPMPLGYAAGISALGNGWPTA